MKTEEIINKIIDLAEAVGEGGFSEIEKVCRLAAVRLAEQQGQIDILKACIHYEEPASDPLATHPELPLQP